MRTSRASLSRNDPWLFNVGKTDGETRTLRYITHPRHRACLARMCAETFSKLERRFDAHAREVLNYYFQGITLRTYSSRKVSRFSTTQPNSE